MKFTSTLQLERLEDTSRDGRGTWRLLAALGYDSDLIGHVDVPQGFVTDLASVPRLPLAFFLAGGLAHAAAVLHDWLYTTHQTDRATADAVFREAAQACGVSPWRAWVMWLGGRAGGASSWGADGPAQPPGVSIQIQQEGLLP
ncbi:DUF1353 domain-containing protein [Acidovorax sp. HMWF029]|uniref:DUF1353 domain-containing protein n=1 Tax=Acidovorax sp. HMWF029 TaxID=2056863 RepID=UPI0018EEBF5C|nr:DUF1353 domain-containing protein [Acidovorax sp. HMWF029]